MSKIVWPPLSSSCRANSIAVVVGGRRHTCAVNTEGCTCIDITPSGNRELWRSKRRSSCGGARWMCGLHRKATPQLFPFASLPVAFHCEQISFLSMLTFAILKHFSGLPNPNRFNCDFWNFDQLPTTRM